MTNDNGHSCNLHFPDRSVAGLIYWIWHYCKWSKETVGQDTDAEETHDKDPDGQTDEDTSRKGSQDS